MMARLKISLDSLRFKDNIITHDDYFIIFLAEE
jgi:hypothetical protein